MQIGDFHVAIAPIDWELLLRYIEVLVWPIFSLIALLTVRPWRIVTRFIEDGGEVSTPVGSLKLSKAIDKVASEIQSITDPTDEAEANEIAPTVSQKAADAYDQIMGGWEIISSEMRQSADAASLTELNWRSPSSVLENLSEAKIVGRDLSASMREMISIRDQVKVNGSASLPKLGIDESKAQEYLASAKRIAAKLKRARRHWLNNRAQAQLSAAAQMSIADAGSQGQQGPLN